MKILISGAGVGGSAAALLLHSSGHDVTLIESAPALDHRGYILPLKYFGIRIIPSLGLWDDLQQSGIRFGNYQILDARGKLLKDIPERLEEIATKGSIFVERPNLHRALHEAASKLAPVRFGAQIDAMAQDGQGATVAYAGGGQERFDLVVISEGLRSATRQMLWGEEGLHSFGVIYAATKIDAPHGIPAQTFRIYFIPGSTLMLAPVSDRQLLVQCYFRGALRSGQPQRQLSDLLRMSATHLPDGLRDLMDRTADRQDMFCDNVGMVTLPDLAKGRAVLMGDAGYCPTFLSGMGASLALLGAKALDVALRKEAGVPAALKKFNAMMQPVIAHYQHNAHGNVQTMLDTSPSRAVLHNWIVRLSPPMLIAHHLATQHDLEKPILKDFEQVGF